MSKVTILVSTNGKVATVVTGAPGKSCLKESAGLDDLFASPTTHHLTPEYHQKESVDSTTETQS